MGQIGHLICEGRTKRIYSAENDREAILYFKDEAIAFKGFKRGRILGKGEVNNDVFAYLYTMLAENGVENHYIHKLDARQSLVKRVEMFPFAIKVRNMAAGTLVERIGLPVGTRLDEPIIEIMYKSNQDEEPLINFSHIRALKLASQEEMQTMMELTARVNGLLTGYMESIGIELIDFKLEFGRYEGRVILADEITPDTARFWDARTGESLDLDRFRTDMGNAVEGYQELWQRMMSDRNE